MTVIRLRAPAGELPAIDRLLLPDRNAQTARNVKLWGGTWSPLRGLLAVGDTTVANPQKLFKYKPAVWFEWAVDVDVSRSPVSNDTWERVYFTGTGTPRVTDNVVSAGAYPRPTASYRIGVPTPTTAPTLSVTGSGSGTAETRYYVYTVVNQYGEEGPPSPVSAKATWQPGQTVNVTLTAVSAGVYAPVTKYYVYRSNNTGDTYQFVGETATTSFADNVDVLGEELPSQEWDPPPDDMVGIVMLPGGILCGFRKNEVLFSEPGLGHAWPVRYRKPMVYNVVRLVPVESGVVVVTEGHPAIGAGSHPASYVFETVKMPHACVAKLGAIAVNGVAVFPTSRGLVAADAGGVRALTEHTVFGEADWEALNPTTFKAFDWRGLYACFYVDTSGAAGGFLINPASPGDGVVTFGGVNVASGFEDPTDGRLFLAVNNQIQEWDAGVAMVLLYRSRPYRPPAPTPMSVVQVVADQYPVTVALYRNGSLQTRREVGDAQPHRLRGACLGGEYEVEFSSDGELSEVVVASSMDELKKV